MDRPYLPASSRVILLYMALAYGLPWVLITALDLRPDYYNEAPASLPALLCTAAAVAFALLVAGRNGMVARPRAPLSMRWLGDGAQIALLGAVAAIALVGFAGEGNRWRYAEEGLSGAGSPLLYLYAMLPLLLRAFLLAYLFLDQRFGDGSNPRDSLKKLLVVAGLFFSINGNGTALLALMGAIALLFLPKARRLLWVTAGRGPSLLRQFGLPALLLPLLAGAWLVGEMVKRDQPVGEVLQWLRDNDVATWLLEILVGRTSPSYFSAGIALDRYAFGLDWGVLGDHLAAPISSFLFRIGQLLPLDILGVPRPADGSIMRINYLMITPLPFNDREGTAPGLVAGFIYSFPFPLNFAVLSLYLMFVAWVIDGLARVIPGRLTAMGTLAMLVFVLPLFESPIDFLLVIDDGTIYLAALLLLRLWCVRSPGPDPGQHGVAARR